MAVTLVPLAAVAVTVSFADLLHYGIERPAERWIRARFSRPDQAELAALAD